MVGMVFGLPGGSEWVILAIVALLIFGGARLANVGKNAGRAIREFKEETQSISKEGSGATAASEIADAELVEPRPESKPENQA